jgi:hypothetical protein
MKPKVYLAGPYSKGDPLQNTLKAMTVGEAVVDMGGVPFIPHLSHYRHEQNPRPYQYWIEEDLEWLPVCHALYRIPGESPGADGEVAEAERLGIPVFYSLEELAKFIQGLGGMGA